MKIYSYSLRTFGGRRICIGKQGENLATSIDVDVTPWKTEYPTGIISLFVVPPVGNGYLAALEENGSIVRWLIRDTDTASIGSGKAELILKDADGTVIKSVTAYTTCTPSVSATEPSDPPEAIRPWVEQILDAIASGALAGIGIESLEQTTISTDDSGINIWTATLTDGSTYQFEVRNGQRGADGAPGEKGEKGDTGSIENLSINGKAPDAGGAVMLTLDDLGAASAERVNQLKDDVAAITPDDTVVDGKPWSSKKTVDSLCMPIEATGNPVQVYPVENYPLGVKVSWEPVQAGEGDPSPDNIRPISGRNAVSVTRCGKNLCNFERDIELNGRPINMKQTLDLTGTFTVSFTCTNLVAERPQAGLFYTVVDGVTKYIGYGEDNRVKTYTGHITEIGILNYGNATGTINTIQLELGSTATPYEPYTGSTTDIALPETVYRGTLDVGSGEGQYTWEKITLDGSESWETQVTNTTGKVGFVLSLPEISTPDINSVKGDVICNQYPTATANDTYCCINGISIESKENRYIRIYDDTHAVGTLAEWKSYLASRHAAGTPVQICYKLAEPVPFTATGTQTIPALSGVNTIYTDADGVVVTGAEDPKHTITELKNAVISLGGNV